VSVGAHPDEAQSLRKAKKLERPGSERAKRGALLRASHVVVRTIAVLLGLPTTVIAVMALLRPFTAMLPLQLGVALVVAVLLPVLAVSRLFLDRPKREATSLSRDVLALVWMGVATGFVGVAQPYTKPWLGAEAQLLSTAGFPHVAHVIELAAAVRPMPNLTASSTAEPLVVAPSTPSPVVSSSATAPAAPPSTYTVDKPAPPPSHPRPDAPLSLAQIVDRTAPIVVTVFVDRPDGIASATGFFVDSYGVVATNRDLVDKATAVGLKRHDGTWIGGAQLLAVSDGLDYALLRFELNGFSPTASVAASTDIQAGTELVTLACPFGLGNTQWVARVSGTTSGYVLVLDQDVPPLRAGSPVVNRFGEVLGMVTAPDRARGSFGPNGAVIGLEPLLRRLESEDLRPRTLGRLPEQEML
jgi:Trypsin-like peptidase domain